MKARPKFPGGLFNDDDIEAVAPAPTERPEPIKSVKTPESKPPESLGQWAKENRPKKRGSIGTSSMTSALTEIDKRQQAETWTNMKPLVLVALYVRAHEYVYGLSPVDLGAKERTLATFAAGRMLRNEFDGSSEVMVEFIRWAWKREHERERWRRANKSDSSFRITWRLMFSGTILADWRLARLRGQV